MLVAFETACKRRNIEEAKSIVNLCPRVTEYKKITFAFDHKR